MTTTISTTSPTLSIPQTSSSPCTAPQPRLLYRGALELPDTHLTLDGLSFSLDVDATGKSVFENKLALALESMRGRPTLATRGLVEISGLEKEHLVIDDNMDNSGVFL